ncbi:MAG: hypothetical protein VCA34_11190 [Roseibacillus sp.]
MGLRVRSAEAKWVIHRLHMPMMPSGKKTGSVVRLPVTQPGKRAGPIRMNAA